VHTIAGDIGARSLTVAPANLEIAAKYIEQNLAKSGCKVDHQFFKVVVTDLFTPVVTKDSITTKTIELTARNVVGEIAGHKQPEEIIVIGAHYDSVFDCPAANDNGSGVAAMLEIARALAALKPNKTVRFVAFANEEQPFFGTESMGSQQYARQCHERGEKIVGMMSLETMGFFSDLPNSQRLPHDFFKLLYPTKGNFIAFVANWRSRHFLDKCVSSFGKAVDFPHESAALPTFIRGVSFSDHASFWNYGYPALMITDTAFYRYPQYHTDEDTPDKLDYDRLARVVSGLIEVIEKL